MAVTRNSLVINGLIAIAAVSIAIPFFWLFGGFAWLQTTVFTPRLPKNMPQNAIWIDAPALPVSWHHGWWFGCSTPGSGRTFQCRLVLANGKHVYSGYYLPCRSKSPLTSVELALVPPPEKIGMWVADNRLSSLAPIGALRNGDLLVPVAVVDRCDELLQQRQ